ncbi:MAG: acyltransferase [Chloroflexales bacterium]
MPQPTRSAPRSPVPAGQHINYLDGLRAAAALFVAVHHAWLESGLPYELLGHAAVGLFLVISGFCLTLPIIRDGGELRIGALSFFKRRAWRILPPYYISIILSIILIWLFLGKQPEGYWDGTYVVDIRGLVTHLFLVQQFFASTSMQISGPAWSIGVEWWIYFLFPALVIMFRRWGALKTVATALGGSLALSLILLQTRVNMDGHGASPQYIALFAFGMLSAHIVYADAPHFVTLRDRVPWAAIVAILVIPIVVLAWPKALGWVPVYLSDYVVGLWSVALLITTSRQGSWLNRFFAWKPLSFVGTFAYSIYLIHAPLLRLIWQYVLLPMNLSPIGNMALLGPVGVPLIVGLSYLFFLVAERPFLNSRRGRRPSQQPS